MSTVVGVFDTSSEAEQAVNELREMGITEDDISIVGREEHVGSGEKDEGHTDAGMRADMGDEGNDLSTGAWTGGALGGLAGLAAGAGAMAIPGIGPVIALGPIAAGLTGAAAGGIGGALIDMGIPPEAGKQYEEEVRKGGILSIIEANEDKIYDTAAVLRKNGARDVETH